MKKTLTTCFVAMLIIVAGCHKEQMTQNSSNINTLSQREGDSRNCYDGVQIVCNHILKFTDMQQFQDVYNCLDQANETWNDNFEAAHATLSDDDYNAYCDSVNFEEDQPSIDFESSLNFYSYRKYMSGLDATWIANGADSTSDPEDSDVIEDDILATMFSNDQAVMINDTIYWIDNNGNMYEVTNGDCALLAQLQADPIGVSANNSKISLFSIFSPASECRHWDEKHDWNPYASDKRYKWKMSFRYYPWGTFIKGKIKSQKRSKGHWKKDRTGLEVTPFGTHYDHLCSASAPYYKHKQKRRKKLREYIVFWGEKHQYKTGDPQCHFRASTGLNTATITF